MKKHQLYTALLLAGLSLLLTAMNTTPVQKSLLQTLKRFADEQGMKAADVAHLTFDFYVKQQFFAKGGVGLIQGDYYVDLRSGKNTLLLPNNQKWVGETFQKREIVFLHPEGDGMLAMRHSLGDFDLFSCVMIVFEPTRVCVLDFAGSSSGFYPRKPETGE